MSSSTIPPTSPAPSSPSPSTPENPTPNPTPEPVTVTTETSAAAAAAAVSAVEDDITSDIAAAKTAAVSLADQARAEYDQLTTASKIRLQRLIGDLEAADQTVLPNIRALFGGK
jgi:3-oxoacyl-ACP reductase-like protein